MGFKENLKDEMLFQDVKMKELADKTGISVNTLRNYINGHNALPNIYSAVKIAQALNTSVEALVLERGGGSAAPDANARRFLSIFARLSENDRKSVMALLNEMRTHQTA